MYTHISIYIYRERGRERQREGEKESVCRGVMFIVVGK